MLKLPQVTLMGIDVVTPERTALSLKESMRWVDFGRVVLLLDGRHPMPVGSWIEIGNTVQSNVMAKPMPWHKPLPVDYEMDNLIRPAEYCDLGYVLYCEWDAGVLNPLGWDPEFLKYDFIGAPWVRHNDPGWPPCDGETNNVGNFGFSLRSKRFCDAIAEAVSRNKGDPTMVSSDRWACRTMRPWLENKGVKFAPWPVAMRFSCENVVYSGQFGFHGRQTAEMNGWGGKWLGGIR
jgi:hypothetical protein